MKWIKSPVQAVKLGSTLANTLTNDTDDDGLTDEQELGTSINKDMMPYMGFLLNRYDIPVGNYTGMTTLAAWKYSSNPVKANSDNDGMLDGKATIVNNKVVIPKDSHPRGTHPMANIWKQQVKQAENKMISQNYQTNVTDNIDDFLSDTFRKAGLDQNIIVKAINRPAKVVIKEIVNALLSNKGKLLERLSDSSTGLAKIKKILNYITDNKTAAKWQPTLERSFLISALTIREWHITRSRSPGKRLLVTTISMTMFSRLDLIWRRDNCFSITVISSTLFGHGVGASGI